MSRFGNLEFGEDSDMTSMQSPALRDEGYYLTQAQGFFERGRFEPSLRAYGKVLEFNPKNASAWFGQVRMLIELDELQEARTWADKALSIFPDNSELLAAKSVALARAGDHDGAISFSDASIDGAGNSPYIWLARGDVLLARKEKRADYCFDKALGFAGGKWVWSWLAARVHGYYRHFARALKYAQEALALSSTEAILWLELGRFQLALGLTAQAQQSLEQALELDSELNTTDLRIEVRQTTFLQKLARRCRQALHL